ncbi:hypothetical protein VYU27_000306 [Nannochloropsis oceanica]
MEITAAKPQRTPSPGLPNSDFHRKGILASLPISSRDPSSSIPLALPVPTAPTLLRTSMPTHQSTHQEDIDKDGNSFSACALATVPLKSLRTPTPMHAMSSQAQERSIAQSIRVATRADVYESVRHVVQSLLDGFSGSLHTPRLHNGTFTENIPGSTNPRRSPPPLSSWSASAPFTCLGTKCTPPGTRCRNKQRWRVASEAA